MSITDYIERTSKDRQTSLQQITKQTKQKQKPKINKFVYFEKQNGSKKTNAYQLHVCNICNAELGDRKRSHLSFFPYERVGKQNKSNRNKIIIVYHRQFY